MMEKTAEKPNERRNGLTRLLLKESIMVTVLNLNNNNLTSLENIDLPQSLIEINLSSNELKSIPSSILNLKTIKILNLSYNKIQYFDETPAFCHTIEQLILSNNELNGPPYWVWCEYPRNLKELDISCNRNIRKSLNNDYFTELLQYKTLLSVIKMHSCNLNSCYELLGTFANAKTLNLGTEVMINANYFSNLPCKGLDKCYNIESLSLRCTYLSLIQSNIDMYKNLIEINLSQNRISSLPKEFCNLQNLQICILSFNSIMYLPDDIVMLRKLTVLCVDSNKLCMLPEKMYELVNLVKLDLYDNYLYDAPEFNSNIQELDLAQNYFDEPDYPDYEFKKKRMRSGLEERIDGRKFETERPESVISLQSSVEDELDAIDYSHSIEEVGVTTSRPASSPEDWDSDDYWVPHFPRLTSCPQSPWLFFVKRKMAEGNFCPMDAHAVSVVEKVRHEKLCKPQTLHEADGQFDDYSSDDS